MNKRTYRHASEIAEALQEYQKSNQHKDFYDDIITEYLVEFFQKLNHPSEERFPDICDIGAHRDTLLLHAIMHFEDSAEDWVIGYRNRYLTTAAQHAINKTSIYPEDFSLEGILIRHNFVRIMQESMPERPTDYSIVDGAWLAIILYFRKFFQKIYVEKGMYQAIQKAKTKGVGGTFGKTRLFTWDCAGRLMITFSQEKHDISFVMESDDPLALGAGVQSCYANLTTVIDMLEDVIANYDSQNFKEDCSISMI